MALTASLLVLLALQAEAPLDYEAFRAHIEPVFVKKREGHARCVVCHTRATTPFRLQELSAEKPAWSDEDSRRNFEAVQRLVVAGEPMKSRLLTMPLSEEAGGNPFHPGGKHWESRDDPEWKTLADWVSAGSTPALDYDFFRTRIEPLFLAKRDGHARCVACHTRATTPFRLQAIPAGRSSWNEEESRMNFEAAARLVAPGEPLRSRLLLMPLSEEAGGTPFHPGGKHWESKDDAEWQSLSEWVRGRH
jgi:hypothetical protein